jgi:ABC-2 type transport system ATP-binding protein
MGIIQADHVHKYFHYQHQRTLKELVQALAQRQKTREYVHALNDVSFTINKGESVGIVGKNGAGKSTLLQLIAGVSSPTSGTLKVQGRIAPFISLGAGFHPDLTGYENIILNGVILGLSEKYIKSKIPEIIEYSELDTHFIETPVKYYSSGMYLRLAFSVGVFTDPDILLIDEILAVGDAQFNKKCFKTLRDFQKNGVTIVFVSHSMTQVEDFCDRVLYMKQGKLAFDGPVDKGVAKFKKDMNLDDTV